MRINAQLIKASTDEHLWANTFNEELTTANLFEVQADIASSIADAMHSTLNPSDLASMEDVPTDNLDAYRAFLKGQEAFGGLTRTSLRVSAESFREAVELDPLFAEAWAALSNSLSARYWEEGGEWDATPDVSLLNAAKQALEQAQELDPDGLDTLIAEAYYLYYGFRDYSSALIVLGRAQASAPHHENVISLRGFLLRRLGRLSEAADALLLAYGNSLNNANSLREIIITLRIAGRCDEANAFATLALEQHPNNEGVLGVSAEVLLICNKNIPGSRSLAERINISTMQHLEWVIQALVFAGDFQAAIKVLTFDPYGIGDNPTNRLTIANQLTWLYREIGQQALAETSLRTAVAAAENITETSAIDLVELAWTEALRGNVKSCLEYGARTLASLPNDAFLQPVFRYKLAIAFAQAGATDAALEQLRIMLGEPRGRQLTLLLKDPYLASLREHPEFQALVTDDA